MQADALSILERKQFESLKHIKEADATAAKLLAEQPDAEDAWLALGAAHYIVGCLSSPKRFFLSLGGIHGDLARNLLHELNEEFPSSPLFAAEYARVSSSPVHAQMPR